MHSPVSCFRSRKEEVGEEILDMLLSFTDFLAFKQTVLDYKAVSQKKLGLQDGGGGVKN